MHAFRARKLGWIAVGLTLAAVPLFFVPARGGYGDPAWAMGGGVVLHVAAFAAIGSLVKYRDLEEDEKPQARVALVALPVLILGALLLLWTWSAP